MPYYRFFWDEASQTEVEEHGVTLDEFEAVVCDRMAVEASRSTGRPIAFGPGDDGRMLACIYEVVDDYDVIPITAYEVDNG